MTTSGRNSIGLDEQEKHTIVITGFGLFRDHETNPSWEAIKEGQLNIDRPNVRVVEKQVSVAYKAVDEIVDNLWKEHKPLLMIHVGLAAFETAIRIEELARHGPYLHDDILQFAPHSNLRVYPDNNSSSPPGEGVLEENRIRREYSCRPCSFSCSKTCVDVEKVCSIVNKAYEEGKITIPAKTSRDAGLYVCEYIYHKSLEACERAIFIHVPDITKFSLEDIRASLKCVVEVLVDEMLDKITDNHIEK